MPLCSEQLLEGRISLRRMVRGHRFMARERLGGKPVTQFLSFEEEGPISLSLGDQLQLGQPHSRLLSRRGGRERSATTGLCAVATVAPVTPMVCPEQRKMSGCPPPATRTNAPAAALA